MSTTKIVAITTGTLLTLGTAYAIYFDYKRRTDPQFRKQLRRGKKAAEQQRKKEERAQESQAKKEITEAYKEVKNDTYPSRPDEMESFFLTEISQAEALVTQGPEMYITAAKHFYRALKVYPNTTELLDIYKKTVPQTLYNLITGLRACEENDDVASHHSMD